MRPESRAASYFLPVFGVVFATVLMASVCSAVGCDISATCYVAAGRVAVLSGATPALCGIRRHRPTHAPAVAWGVAPDRT